jgi:hypothetical protein
MEVVLPFLDLSKKLLLVFIVEGWIAG